MAAFQQHQWPPRRSAVGCWRIGAGLRGPVSTAGAMDLQRVMKMLYISNGYTEPVMKACDSAWRAGCASSLCEASNVRRVFSFLPESDAYYTFLDWRRSWCQWSRGSTILDERATRSIIRHDPDLFSEAESERLMSLAREADRLGALAQEVAPPFPAMEERDAFWNNEDWGRALKAAMEVRDKRHARAEEAAAEARMALLTALGCAVGSLAAAVDALLCTLPGERATHMGPMLRDPFGPKPPGVGVTLQPPKPASPPTPVSRKRSAGCNSDDYGDGNQPQDIPSDTPPPSCSGQDEPGDAGAAGALKGGPAGAVTLISRATARKTLRPLRQQRRG